MPATAIPVALAAIVIIAGAILASAHLSPGAIVAWASGDDANVAGTATNTKLAKLAAEETKEI